ncbi:MAG: hypothetical protein PHV60_04705 [bacterium]|nr:hypothetical protein [bacterium]
MRRLLLTGALFFIFAPVLLAQENPPAENELIEYQSKSPISRISGGRQMILDKLKNGDLKKAREVFDLLENTVDKTVYAPFYKIERFQLIVLLEQYDILRSTASLEGIINIDKDWQKNKIVSPPNDGLYTELDKMLKDRKDDLLKNCNNVLTAEEAGFLELHTAALINGDTKNEVDELNKKAEAFLLKYPGGKYEQFVRNYIRIVYKKGQKGWGCSLGMGSLSISGDLDDYFANKTTLNIAFDYFYHKMLFDMDMSVGFAKGTKEPFTHQNDSWPQGTSTVLSVIGLQTGYNISRVRKMELYPFIGVSFFSFSSGQEDRDNGLDFADINATAFSYGFNWDFVFKESKDNNAFYWYGQETVSRLRLKFIASNPRFSEKLKGAIYNISLSYNFSFWQVERDH